LNVTGITRARPIMKFIAKAFRGVQTTFRMVLNEIKKILLLERCWLRMFCGQRCHFVRIFESAALNASTSPAPAIFTSNVRPSFEDLVSFIWPLRRQTAEPSGLSGLAEEAALEHLTSLLWAAWVWLFSAAQVWACRARRVCSILLTLAWFFGLQPSPKKEDIGTFL
jgi:hypothetical protein